MSVASDRRVNNNHRPLKIREIPYKSPPPSFVLCSCCRAPPNNHVTRNIASQSPFIASGCRASGLNHPGTSSGQHNATPKNFIKYNRVSNNPYRHDTYPPHVRYPSAPTLAEPENGTESPGSVRSYASRRLPRTDQLLTPRSSCVKPPPNRTHLRSDNIVIERMGVMKPPRCPLHSSKDDSKHDDSVHVSKSGDTCACESR
uniref:Uncharacterized protein n=1 Tax=Ciona savignyi TaxID=51511 RepID=H2Z338_CIOSA